MAQRPVALLVATAIGAGTALIALATPAHAGTDTVTTLPLSTFADLVVDDAHGHVFVSGGGSSGVVVRTLEGAAVTTITNEPGASQMALSEDGSRLYVALANGDAISAIDTTTLTEATRYPTGANACPSTVAVTSGKVWFGYACSDSGTNLGVIDPAAASPSARLGLLPANTFWGVPGLQSSPARPGLLAVGDLDQSFGSLKLVDVSTGTPKIGASHDFNAALNDWAFTADGAHIVTATGDSSMQEAWKSSDLSADGVYGDANQTPNSVALGAGGAVAGGSFATRPAVKVSRADGSLIRSYDFGDCDTEGSCLTLTAGAAFDADAGRLYVATTDWYFSTVVLRVLHDPAKSASTVTLAKPSSATINHGYTINGTLASSSAIPAGAAVTVQRSSTYGTVTLPDRTTASDGTFAVTDTVSQRGSYTYTASFAGDATHAAATGRVVVPVIGLATTLTITTSSGPYSYGARPVVVAHLGTTKLRALSLYATPYGGTRKLLKAGSVDAHGNLSVAYTMTRRTAFTAVFAGDSTYQPRSYAKTLLSRVRLVSALTGSYGTSGSYRLVHAGVDPRLTVTVYPNNHKSCLKFVAQRYSSGAWRADGTFDCVALDYYSKAWIMVTGKHPRGTLIRLRPTFVGSTLNAATVGPYTYLRFTT